MERDFKSTEELHARSGGQSIARHKSDLVFFITVPKCSKYFVSLLGQLLNINLFVREMRASGQMELQRY